MRAIIALALLVFAGVAHSQTVSLTASPSSGVRPVTPTLTWSTTPAATSCTASGGWAGSKAASGTEVLPAILANTNFTLTCQFGTNGTATVDWTAPTTNTNGSPLTDLAGFRVMYGTSSGNLSQARAVNDATARSITITGLGAGTWFFSVRALNANGAESSDSNIASKVVAASVTRSASASITVTQPPTVPNPPTNVTVTMVETLVWDVRKSGGQWYLSRHVGDLPVGTKCEKDKPLAVANGADGASYYTVSVPIKVRRTFPKAVSSTARLVASCA